MKTKIDFVRLTNVLRKHKRIMDLITFIKEIIHPLHVNDYKQTLELHLLLYNIILNGLPSKDYVMETLMQEILEKMFDDVKMTADEIEKMKADINYIRTAKLFTKISWCYVQFRNIVDFFF